MVLSRIQLKLVLESYFSREFLSFMPDNKLQLLLQLHTQALGVKILFKKTSRRMTKISPYWEPTNSHQVGLQNKSCFHVRAVYWLAWYPPDDFRKLFYLDPALELLFPKHTASVLSYSVKRAKRIALIAREMVATTMVIKALEKYITVETSNKIHCFPWLSNNPTPYLAISLSH